MRKRPAAKAQPRIHSMHGEDPCDCKDAESRARVLLPGHGDAGVPHYYDVALQHMDMTEIRVAVPSYDRPDILCEATLKLLRGHGFPMSQVHVFVSPRQSPNAQEPEWHRYLTKLRREGFREVNLEVGCDGLEHQMHAIFMWACRGYVIVMTDDVRDILERKKPRTGSRPELTPLPLGMLRALFLHGRNMLQSHHCFAWSVNCSQNVRHLDESKISRRFGLLEGNLMGFLLEGNPEDWRVAHGLGVVYDVALSCNLWSTGRWFLRYRGLCLTHRYRAAGGYQASLRPQERRVQENRAIRRLERSYPELIKFQRKPKASLCTMQYHMVPQGSEPLSVRAPSPVTAGRRFEAFADRAMTDAERQRRCRRRKRSLRDS